MIIYNITFHVDNTILEEYIEFLKKQYIPEALKGEILESPRLCKILADSKDGSSSYSLQFHVENTNLLNDWWKENGNRLNDLMLERFADKVMGFTTLLESIDHEQI